MLNTFYHGRYSLSNLQWNFIESFLPKPKVRGRPALNPRTVFNAILWILGSGAAWRDLPKEYGNWNSIYHKFRSWIEAGVFEKILKSLIEDCREYYLVEIDSTFCKVHQHAAGVRKVLGNQDIGISRGGKTTKIHALVNENFQLLNIDGKNILGDKAYGSKEFRVFIAEHNAKACIPDKINAVIIHDFDKELYKARNIIERFFNRIKNFRRIATRYDKLSICFLNFVLLAV